MKKLILGFIILLSANISSEPINSDSLRFYLNDRLYNFDGIVRSYITKRSSKTEIMISLEDKAQKAELFLIAIVPSGMESNSLRLSSEHHDIKMIFKSKEISFMIEPSTVLLEEHFKEAHWHKMSKAERMKNGKGIIRNPEMEGTNLYLNITPVFSGKQMVEITGNFSGVSNIGLKNSSLTTINHGEFKARLIQ